jgi:hypothetical protein
LKGKSVTDTSNHDAQRQQHQPVESQPGGADTPREKNPTQQRAEEQLDKKRDTSREKTGAPDDKKRRPPSPSDLFNGA